MLRNSAINFVLKAGLIVASLGFALYSLLHPNSVLGLYPQFASDILGDMTLIVIGALTAVFMAIWLISRRNKFACASTFLVLMALAMIANIGSIRFISAAWPLFVIALALAVRYYPRVRIIVAHKDGEKMRIVPIEPEEAPQPAIESAPLAHAEPAAPLPTIDEAPADLASDPAQTAEFLNSEKFVEGHKFFDGETEIIDEPISAAPATEDASLVSIDMTPAEPIVKPKRAYKPRAKAATAKPRSSRKSAAHSEIHEEF